MRPLSGNVPPNHLNTSCLIYKTVMFRTTSAIWFLGSLDQSGSPGASAHAIYLNLATNARASKRRDSAKSSSSFAMRIPLWFVVLVQLDLATSHQSLISNMFCKRSYLFSDNYLRMSKMQFVLCASSPWFQWQKLSQKKKIRSTHLELFLLPAKTSHGKYACVLLRTSRDSPILLVRKSRTTTWSRPFPYY